MASSSQYRMSPAPPSAFANHHRQRPSSRRTASSYDVRSFETPAIQHHRTASSSSSALPFTRQHAFSRPRSPAALPPLSTAADRFSRMFPSSLGSPFLTTSEPPLLETDTIDLNAADGGRPSSPAPTADFSIIDMDAEDSDSNPFIPGSYPTTQPKLISSLSFSRGRQMASGSMSWGNSLPPQNSNSLKSFLPRLWDALSSPGRTMLNVSPSPNITSLSPSSSPSSSRTASPSSSPRHRPGQSWYTNNGTGNGRHSPGYWASGSLSKAKGKLFSSRNGNTSRNELNENINYSELPPLDGEEGELIDDEACFIRGDVHSPTGIDILSLLPPELALHILSLVPYSRSTNFPLSPGRSSLVISEADSDHHEALMALLSCRLVSSTWCRLANDNAVWRSLFLSRWSVDLKRALDPRSRSENIGRSVRAVLGKTWDYDMTDIGEKAKRVLGLSSPPVDAPISAAPLRLDWRLLYRERLELDLRWSGAPCLPAWEDMKVPSVNSRWMGGVFNGQDHQIARKRYDPKPMRITGHNDSVYCLEFDSRRIITGSRDKSIKVWSLQTGKLLGTFKGAHSGSVLCLKFEKDWDREWGWDDEDQRDDASIITSQSSRSKRSARHRTGFMVSGSSDCSICVWDLHLGPLIESDDSSIFSDDHSISQSIRDDGERQVHAEVRAKLKGHAGGVLDLRIDRRWIVSCSKDAAIRVWDRKTLEQYRVLRGHEGPVNAVGLQNGRVVSASGDGRLILWDIESGERLRTLEGHNRGLACIEFKGDLIVSGSNDCKIKIWNASTGECLRDLTGHEALVRALSFDPRSGRLVSASYDRSIKLWDLGTGKLVREFRGSDVHTSHIFDVKFDMARIVSTSHDQKIVVHDFSAGLNTALFV